MAMDPRPESRDLPTSPIRFDDGAHFRIEIPSTESAAYLREVLAAAAELKVPVHRASQGSGVFMLTDAEITDFADVGTAAGVEVCLFARPTSNWDIGAAAHTETGALFSGACRGEAGLEAALRHLRRATDLGIRSALISDLGLLSLVCEQRRINRLPADLRLKMAASFPVTNGATARVLASLGADTINVAGDLSLEQYAAMRAAVSTPFDIYIESPGALGGLVRIWEVAEIVRVAAPVYLKFGIRNSPDLYPTGTHHAQVSTALARERVRRARLALDEIQRSGHAFQHTPARR
ncbi:U32 family peptidase, partial [Nonomuraea sp. RK-328]|nr:U32 family peptidase [Nonomuraea sp. RK-328]